MKSIKPGRGPSGMSFIGSIFAIMFGVIWTIGVASSGAPAFFTLFGMVFVGFGIVQALYNYKNATGKNRYSLYDITDSSEESDPAEAWIKDNFNNEIGNIDNVMRSSNNFCPYCGEDLESDYKFCPKCGKQIN